MYEELGDKFMNIIQCIMDMKILFAHKVEIHSEKIDRNSKQFCRYTHKKKRFFLINFIYTCCNFPKIVLSICCDNNLKH